MIHLDTPTTSLGQPALLASATRLQVEAAGSLDTEASCVWSLDKVGLCRCDRCCCPCHPPRAFACSLVTSDLRQSQAVRSVCFSRQLATLLHVNSSKGSSTRHPWSGEETTQRTVQRDEALLCDQTCIVLFILSLPMCFTRVPVNLPPGLCQASKFTDSLTSAAQGSRTILKYAAFHPSGLVQ
ncbi:Uncharacterized protein HZ326_22566 [Fusarium oxysporum f. sp. albedinis]|nr:Uncharacterized protein HZ326_22566 [Fusarium oxysporum f. sp. albedinis]